MGPPPRQAPAGRLPRLLNARTTFAALVALLVLSRLLFLGADPPWWQPGEFITDEGWWADSARGIHLFGDPFADDFGTGYLLCPLYTKLLVAVYDLFGLGLVQTRAVVAAASLLLVLVPAFLLRRQDPRLAGAFLLLAVPDLVLFTYGRVAILESILALCALLAALPWVGLVPARGRRGQIAAGALSGAALAASLFVKPNALTYCVFPVGLTALCSTLAGRRPARLFVTALAAGSLGLAVGLVLHVLPEWPRFWASLSHEAGLGVSEDLPPAFLLLGNLFSSQGVPGGHRLLWLLKTSPALLFFGGLFAAALARLCRGRGLRAALRALPDGVFGPLVWLLATLAVYELTWHKFYRRLPLVIVPAALLAARALAGRAPAGEEPELEPRGAREPGTGPAGAGYLERLVAFAPVLLLAAGLLTPRLAAPLRAFLEGRLGLAHPRGTHAALGLCLLALYLGLCAARRLAGPAARLLAWAQRLAPAAVVLLLGYQLGLAGSFLAHPREHFARASRALAARIEPGAVVLGDFASTLLFAHPVRTVRRVARASFSGPPPNPDVVDRLDPHWLIDREYCGYEFFPRHYAELDRRYGFTFTARILVPPLRHGIPRYSFLLFHRD